MFQHSCSEIDSVQKQVLIHFNIIEAHGDKVLPQNVFLAKPYHRFAYLCLDNIKMYKYAKLIKIYYAV